MKVSLEWLTDFVRVPAGVTPAGLAHQLTLRTVEVEDVIDVGAPLAGTVVGHVEGIERVPGHPHVAVDCRIGPGRMVTAVSRAEDLAPGMAVAVALPGARLSGPGGEPVDVSTMDVAGRRWTALVGTAEQLGLGRMFPGGHLSGIDAPAGTPLAEALGFDDVVLDIDNKSLTNRPDLWGHYGIARELAAIYRVPLAPLPTAPPFPPPAGAPADGRALGPDLVADVDERLCRRFAAVAFELRDQSGSARLAPRRDPDQSPDPAGLSPLWLRSRLARLGEASVNLCVDLANYVMFTVGQPTQVYDADRITLPLAVRATVEPVTVPLPAGPATLEPGTPVVVDADGPVALAGILGAAAPAARGDSRRFVLEVATFRPRPVRRAAQRLGLRTEASARFEKGLDTQRVDQAVGLYLDLLARLAPGARVTATRDVDPDPTPRARIAVDPDFLARRIGTALEPDEIRRILVSLGFHVESTSRLDVTVPTWRSTGDVSLPHDLVEEVARVHGYDALPVAPLNVTLRPVRDLRLRPVDRVVREQLAARAGMREVVTYPWVADALLAAAGLDGARTVRFDGAPAPDRATLRPSLVPNLLEVIAANLRYADEFAVFEVGTVFRAGPPGDHRGRSESLPEQPVMLAGAVVGRDGEVFRRAKGALEMLAREARLGDLATAAGTAGQPGAVGPAPAWADRSARVAITANGAVIGALALLTKRSRRLAGIDAPQVACFELELDRLSPLPSRDNRFEVLPALPEADFDLSVVVGDGVGWSRLEAVAVAADPLVHRVAFLDEYRGSWVPAGHRSVSLRATLRPAGTTLTAEAIGRSRRRVVEALAGALGAGLRE
ncbi:phenylalanine--tRNA ligase subunit beta [Rugosimonospora acidiphila]|uniref:phenylalanine--tRNA ligase n=1 Tax=Rugosimonospora acidiphila TaxID=556531 RepID=A0ABP9SQW1_9ACTN